MDFGNNDLAPSDKLVERLRQNGISVAEVLAFDHPMLANILSASDSQIIVLFPLQPFLIHKILV